VPRTKALKLSGSKSQLLSNFLNNVVNKLVMLAGFLIALSALEINVGPIMAIVGAAGFVVAFALQGTLSNFASGIMMMVYRPFDIGDVINVAGIQGSVKSMNLVSTTIATPDNRQMVIPNNSIWGDVITNVTASDTRRVDMTFGIGYGDDITKAQNIIEDILSAHPLVLNDPAPVVKLNELADSSVNFVCRPWVNTGDYWDVYWDVTRGVKDRFDAEGISIPYPQTDVHIIKDDVK
jgi:small conductance mechanosensitive channel